MIELGTGCKCGADQSEHEGKYGTGGCFRTRCERYSWAETPEEMLTWADKKIDEMPCSGHEWVRFNHKENILSCRWCGRTRS